MRHPLPWIALIVALLAIGCGNDDDDTTPGEDTSDDSGDDASGDSGGGDSGEDVADVDDDADDAEGDVEIELPEPTGAYVDAKSEDVDELLVVEGLKYPVHITIDEWGIPHILAESIEDAMYAQGFMQARDRFAQLEFFRRFTGGTTSLLGGALDPSVIEDDIFVRLMGYGRVGRQVYEGWGEESIERRSLDAYAAGINVVIDEILAGDTRIPAPLAFLINPQQLRQWQPWDGLAIIRYQQADLGFEADTDVEFTAYREAARAVFNAEAEDERYQARAGLAVDMFQFAPSRATFETPGFPDDAEGGTLPIQQPNWMLESTFEAPDPEALEAALSLNTYPRSTMHRTFSHGVGFSNSWTIAPEMSASGHALLANDPHLGLDSPTVFHQAHIVVEPRTEADGPAVNCFGFMFPGLPGIVIGHNENVAWGQTVANFDYSDAFVEELVWVDGQKWPDIMRNGEQVQLDIIVEEIEIGSRGEAVETIEVELPWVPGQGPLAVEIDGRNTVVPEGDQAISYAWRGFDTSNEFAAVLGFMTASDVDEFDEAIDHWLIGTQMVNVADSSGNIFNTGRSYIPERVPEAMTYHATENPDGTAPWWTLDPNEHMWTGEPLPGDDVPQVKNPDRGYIINANNDQGGVTADNDPLNDWQYVGHSYDIGFRAGRIEDRLTNATGERDSVELTPEDLMEIQFDTYSNMGAVIAPILVQIGRVIVGAYDDPGSVPELEVMVDDNPGARDRIEELVDLLDGWSYEAHSGLAMNPSADDIAASNATTFYNIWQTTVIRNLFWDERNAAPGLSFPWQGYSRVFVTLMQDPSGMATYDGEYGDTILWDDLATEEIETKLEIMFASLLEADAWLTDRFGADTEDWIWGELHGRFFDNLIPDTAAVTGDTSPFVWPQDDEGYSNGFPMNGDNWNVNPCNGGVTDYGYNCSAGASLRFVVELDPDGVRSWNASPGGQHFDNNSPHFRDQLEMWLVNERYETRFHPSDVAAGVENHIVLY